MRALALLLLAASISAAPPKKKPAPRPAKTIPVEKAPEVVKPDPCADPRVILKPLVARALEHGDAQKAGPSQARLLGSAPQLKRLTFDGEPTHVFDVIARLEPDGEYSAESLLLTRIDRSPFALHREMYKLDLDGRLRGGAVFGDSLDAKGEPVGGRTLYQPFEGKDPTAREAYIHALTGLCREAQSLSGQERLEELGGLPPDLKERAR